MIYLEISEAIKQGKKVYWKNKRYEVVKMQHVYSWWCPYGVKDVYSDWLSAMTENDVIDCFIGE